MTEQIDYTGKRYDMLVGVYPTNKRYQGGVVWLWKCDCGQTKSVPASHVHGGHTRSCGCLGSGPKATVFVGEKYKFLTVIKEIKEGKHRGRQWLCKCDCGQYKKVCTSYLRGGNTKSCGCRAIVSRHLLKSVLSVDDIPIEMVRAYMALNNNKKILKERKKA